MKKQNYGLTAAPNFSKSCKDQYDNPPNYLSNRLTKPFINDPESKPYILYQLRAVQNYRDNRENGSKRDDPSRQFSADGFFFWQWPDGSQHQKTGTGIICYVKGAQLRYEPGSAASAWMNDKDQKYLARLQREKEEVVELQYQLGLTFSHGSTRAFDKNDVEWYLNAAKQGIPSAQYMLGLMYARGLGVEKSNKNAANLFQLAAEQKYIAAICEVAYMMYKPDRGVSEDADTALLTYRKAVVANPGKGDSNQGIDPNGQKLPYNLVQTVKWFSVAAQQNHPGAQYKLGLMYEKGLGVVQNYELAVKLYQKSAKQNNPDATARLADISKITKIDVKKIAHLSVQSTPKKQHTPSHLATSYLIPYQELKIETNQLLGKGGYGVVYRGTWQHSVVAIKQLLLTGLTADILDEFTLEAAVLKALHHPNVVTFFGASIDTPGKFCLVMELMPRGNLFNLLHNNQPLTWEVRMNIAVDIAAGLSHLHGKNIFHRDLKSLNILLDDRLRAKITDFGLAKIKTQSRITTTTQVAGTVAWMAPEQFKRNYQYTTKTDIYSYGMILWEIASREIPFKDAQNEQLLISWLTQGEQENIPQETPGNFAKLIKWCWEKESTKRPTADEAVTELKSIQEEFQEALKL